VVRSFQLLFAFASACADAPGVSPATGRSSGGEPLRIVGEGFLRHGAPVVYVGPRAAKAIVVEGDRLITLLTPESDAPGTVDIEIHFADGEVVPYPGAFTYEDRGVVLRPGG